MVWIDCIHNEWRFYNFGEHIGIGPIGEVCNPVFSVSLFLFAFSHPPSHSFLSLLLQSGMTHQYCCGAYRKCGFDRPVERQHSSSSDMRMHYWTTAREHSQHFDDITHPHTLAPASICLLLKQALSHSKRNEQASVKEQELAGKRRGCLWANGEGECFGGRWRVADSVSRLGLAYTHGKRREKKKEYCCELRLLLWTLVLLFSLISGAKVLTQFCPSPFWIFLCWNGDERLCGLATGQQTLGWNTSLSSQICFFFTSTSVVLLRARWQRKQTNSTSSVSFFRSCPACSL